MLNDPILECNWDVTLPVYNSIEERNRVKKINPNLWSASYPLTRTFLNDYFNKNKFSFSSYSSFVYDCAASMYSFFLMTYGYNQSGNQGGASALPAVPGGGGISYGFNPFFGLFDIDNPLLWILLAIGGILIYKKISD
jgi:hypothetical protein